MVYWKGGFLALSREETTSKRSFSNGFPLVKPLPTKINSGAFPAPTIIQRGTQMYVNLAKKDPGKARQSS